MEAAGRVGLRGSRWCWPAAPTATDEPGLFPTPAPTPSAPPPPRGRFPPQPTNPKLPVAGERHLGQRRPAPGHVPVRRARRTPDRGRDRARLVGHPARAPRASSSATTCPASSSGSTRPARQRRRRSPCSTPSRTAGLPAAEPPVAAGVQPLPVHAALGRPAGPADRRDPAAADRLPELPAATGVRRRQPGHGAAVRPRPGQPDRHRSGGPAADRPGPTSRRAGPRPPSRSSSATRRAGRGSAADPDRPGHRRPRPDHAGVDPAARSPTRTPSSSAVRAAGRPARRRTTSTC